VPAINLLRWAGRDKSWAHEEIKGEKKTEGNPIHDFRSEHRKKRTGDQSAHVHTPVLPALDGLHKREERKLSQGRERERVVGAESIAI